MKESVRKNMDVSDIAWNTFVKPALISNNCTILEEYQEDNSVEDTEECTDYLISHPAFGEMRIGYRHFRMVDYGDNAFSMRIMRHLGTPTEIPKLIKFRDTNSPIIQNHYTIGTAGNINTLKFAHMAQTTKILEWIEKAIGAELFSYVKMFGEMTIHEYLNLPMPHKTKQKELATDLIEALKEKCSSDILVDDKDALFILVPHIGNKMKSWRMKK